MSGMATYTPGMEISGGSLGQGLPIAVGMALGLRQKKNPAFVYNSMSDGELDEGSTWEAAMGAAHHRPRNLICLVDINNQQADGPSGKIMGFEPLADKWAAFGWHVQRVDGNDLPAVLAAFDAARALDGSQAARDPVRHADGQGRALPRDSARRTTSSASTRRNGSRPSAILDQHRKPKEPWHERRRRRKEAAPDHLGDDRLDRRRRAARQGRAVRQGAGRARPQRGPRSSA